MNTAVRHIERCRDRFRTWIRVMAPAARIQEEHYRSGAYLADPDRDIELMPYWATTPVPEDAPEALRSAYARFLRRVDADPDRRKAWDQVLARRDELASASDPVVHFARISRGLRHRIHTGTAHPGAVERLTRWVHLRRLAVVGMSAYLVAIAVSLSFTPELQRRATLGLADYSWAQLGETTRGSDEPWQLEIRTAYKRSLYLARSSMKWRWPTAGFDREQLEQARKGMQTAIHYQSRRETAPERAYLILGKLNILLGDTEAAVSALKVACSRGGEAGEEARELLLIINR